MASLNLIMCHRSINYMAEMMETAYGIPWIKVNFIGVQAMAKSLRKIARYFEDPALIEKVDADSRNIEELKVEPDPERYKPRKDPETLERFKQEQLVGHYDGMIPEMNSGTLVIDDISHAELERLILDLEPDIVCSGIKDKYVIEKFGVPSKQLHNYDYSGPYAGFRGAVNFACEVDMMVHNRAWKLLKAPWQKEPALKARLASRQ